MFQFWAQSHLSALSAFELFKPFFNLPFKCQSKVSLGIEYFSQTSLNPIFHLLCSSMAFCVTLGPPGDDFAQI
jgi:hypothetical protein